MKALPFGTNGNIEELISECIFARLNKYKFDMENVVSTKIEMSEENAFQIICHLPFIS